MDKSSKAPQEEDKDQTKRTIGPIDTLDGSMKSTLYKDKHSPENKDKEDPENSRNDQLLTGNQPAQSLLPKKGSQTKQTVWDKTVSLTLYFLLLSVGMMLDNPIKAYIKTFDNVFKVSNKYTSFSFSLCACCSMIIGVPANIFLTKYGIKRSLIVMLVTGVVGFVIRIFTYVDFNLYIIGTVIIGFGSPFLNNLRVVIIADWFEGKTVSLMFFLLLGRSFGSFSARVTALKDIAIFFLLNF